MEAVEEYDFHEKYLELAKGLGAISPEFTFYESDGDVVYHLIDDHKATIAYGSISHFPGCCGIGVLHDAWGRDYAHLKLMFQLRQEIAMNEPWGLLLQTHIYNDAWTRRVMRELGWIIPTYTRKFFNPNSDNRVTVWTKRINQENA